MVPYQLGSGADRKAVKYSVKPCTQTSEFITKQTNPDYLRTALRSTLQEKMFVWNLWFNQELHLTCLSKIQ
jgi:hypothetical protein